MENSLSLPCDDTVRRQSTASQNKASPGIKIHQHLDLGLPASRTVRNKFMLFKLASLCYFVVIARDIPP